MKQKNAGKRAPKRVVGGNKAIDAFFKKMDRLGLALTYADVRCKTDYSEVLPSGVSQKTNFSRNITLGLPIVSAAMDTVTGARMAIAMAMAGGIGVIHKNMSPKDQASEVAHVKFFANGRVNTPICVNANATVEAVLEMRINKDREFHSFPVLRAGKLVGMITRKDFQFAPSDSVRVSSIMTRRNDLIVADAKTSSSNAYEIMMKHKTNVLPLVNKDGTVDGLYVFSDLDRIRSGRSTFNTDSGGHLRVAAAVGVDNGAMERAEMLAPKGCDAFIIDTAHGDSRNVIETVKRLKKYFPHIDVVPGNVSRGESALRLVDAGADGVLVGQGPGSICTTRIIAGIGCPQVTAVYECSKALRGSGVPVIADGGIGNSGDIVVALAIGAESVVLGRLLAGTEESTGTTVTIDGVKKKHYRGMGSLGAMRDYAASRDRYRQSDVSVQKLVPEGIESVVPYVGFTRDVLDQFAGGIRAGMGYIGTLDLVSLRKKAELIRLTAAGLAESHPHDVAIVAEAPNYRRS